MEIRTNSRTTRLLLLLALTLALALAGCDYQDDIVFEEVSDMTVNFLERYSIDGWIHNEGKIRYHYIYVVVEWFDEQGRSLHRQTRYIGEIGPDERKQWQIAGNMHDRYHRYELYVVRTNN